MFKGHSSGLRTGGLLAVIGLWALVAGVYAWVERDALFEWIVESVERPTPSETPAAPFDPPDCPLCPFTAASPPGAPSFVPLDLWKAESGKR